MLVGTALLQTAVLPAFSINNVHPDLMLVIVLAWSFLYDFRQAMGWAFVGGILLDMLSPVTFGVFSAGLIAVAWLGSFWRDRFSGGAWLVAILLVLPYSILYNVLTLLLVGASFSWQFAFLRVIFPAALLDMLAMAVVLPLSVLLTRYQRRTDLTIG